MHRASDVRVKLISSFHGITTVNCMMNRMDSLRSAYFVLGCCCSCLLLLLLHLPKWIKAEVKSDCKFALSTVEYLLLRERWNGPLNQDHFHDHLRIFHVVASLKWVCTCGGIVVLIIVFITIEMFATTVYKNQSQNHLKEDALNSTDPQFRKCHPIYRFDFSPGENSK